MKFVKKFSIFVLTLYFMSLFIQPVLCASGVSAGDELTWKIYGKVDAESTNPDYALIGTSGDSEYKAEISVNVTKVEGNVVIYNFSQILSWRSGSFYDDIDDVPVTNTTSVLDSNDCDVDASNFPIFIDPECQTKQFSDTIDYKGHSASVEVQYTKDGVFKSYKRTLGWRDSGQEIKYSEEFTIRTPFIPSFTPIMLIIISAVSILGIMYRIKKKSKI